MGKCHIMLSPRGDKAQSLKMMWFSMSSRFTFEQLRWIIPVTEKSLSEQCEGGLKCIHKTTNKYISISNILCLDLCIVELHRYSI